ncbi:hypothetical protein ABT381_03070 [Streptomyces sp. NPDC000151]|uniref:hypothetical protein n=1 Tax=Streptomyces sp. NPDC000151 TaxID=3154244 RepID=UPI0033213815
MNLFKAGDKDLDLTNGGTKVFIDVLTLAVSDLVEDPWDYRFAGLLSLQDQNVMGRGGVGFDLRDIDWGATPQQRARSKQFVLRAANLALTRHRWYELDYDPPYAEGYLRRFIDMMASFTPPAEPRPDSLFPCEDDDWPHAAIASCVRHRVLSALPMWNGCIFCS